MDENKPSNNENDLEGQEPSVDSGPASESTQSGNSGVAKPKKTNPVKNFFRRFNVYLLIFVLLLIIGGAYALVVYLNSKKVPPQPIIQTEQLTQETLDQLAKGDASVGSSTSVLNVQSNAVFSGQVLIGGDLNVAGTLKLGKPLSVANITVSDKANLNEVQISNLQVAKDSTFKGSLLVQKNFNVSGSSDFNGGVRMSSLTTTDLTISGAGEFILNGHIVAGGGAPQRTYGSKLGSGGTVTNSGSDTAGIVVVNTGGGGGNGCMATITFRSPFRVAPYVALTPASYDASKTGYYIKRTKTNFQICTSSPTSKAAGKSMSFTYVVLD